MHRSDRWFDNIVANVRRLEGHAAITVSDASGEDDCLPRLRTELSTVSGLTFLGPRPIAPGWVSHCNDLLERTNEEFFTWLPHDDEIGADWVTEAESRLDHVPGAVLALGRVEPVTEPGVTSGGLRIEPYAPFALTDQLERVRHALEVCMVGDTSLQGAAFRGVMRTSLAAPLPTTRDDGEWSDILWAVRMLTRGSFVATPSIYGKRWHPASTHMAWSVARHRDEFRNRWIPEALSDIDPSQREALLIHAWATESLSLIDARDTEHANARAAFEKSRSWRITAPLRSLRSAMRRRDR